MPSEEKPPEKKQPANNNNKTATGSNNNNHKNSKKKIHTGYIGTFLLEHHYSLDDIDLIGTVPTETSNPTLYQTIQAISNFLTHHKLAEAAEHTNVTTIIPSVSTNYYLPTLKEFEKTQLERQAAGLRTNANKETASGLQTLIENHTRALQRAWNNNITITAAAATTTTSSPTTTTTSITAKPPCANAAAASNPTPATATSTAPAISTATVTNNDNNSIKNNNLLSKEEVCEIHGILCLTLHKHAGKYRTSQARAGHTWFCPPKEVDQEMTRFFEAYQRYRTKWKAQQQTDDSNNNDDAISKVYHAVALAALVMYGICDVHPFSDGNGRLSRIYANAILRQELQLPFSITLVATAEQRKEYIQGLQQGHSNLQKITKRKKTDDKNKTSTTAATTNNNTSGALQPLILMLLERIGYAIVQAQSLLEEKARVAADAHEAKILRQARERAAEGQCIICLGARPNIATLCCGQAVHLNCIAEWLANGTTCVYCRNPLPRMNPPRPPDPVVSSFAADDDDDDDDDDIQHRTMPELLMSLALRLRATSTSPPMVRFAEGETFTTTTTSDDDDDDDDNDQQQSSPPPLCIWGSCVNRAASDCDNAMCGRCCVLNGFHSCSRHGHVGAEDTMTTTTTEEDDDHRPQCQHCQRNIAAQDCDNSMCARCCLQHGEDDCDRHEHYPNNDTTTDTTTTSTEDQRNSNVTYCSDCGRNRAALDCDSLMCGRCCVMSNSYCSRHNG